MRRALECGPASSLKMVTEAFAAQKSRKLELIYLCFLCDLCPPSVQQNTPEAVKALAEEVLDFFRGQCPGASFAQAFQAVRQRVAQKRLQRRKEAALDAVLDPVAAAKRRKARADKQKKRKRAEMRDAADWKGKRIRKGPGP